MNWHVSSWRGVSVGVGALLLAVGCGDDSPVQPGGTSSSGTTTGSSGMVVDDTTGTTSGGGSTSLDSSGGTGATTTGVDSTGPTGGESSSSSGEPVDPPQAIDDLYFVREDQAPLVVDAATGVLANDVAFDGGALDIEASDPMSMAGGTVVMQPDGSFDYTPPADFFGDDVFTYTVREEGGGSAQGTVVVTVGPLAIDDTELVAGVGGFVIDGAAAGDESGYDVSGGGDVDGDGLDDLLVTSIDAGGGAGRTWVVFGKSDPSPVDLNDVTMGVGGFVILGEGPSDQAGHAAAIVGDVNGDGLADVAIGAPLVGGAGWAYVVHGKADGLEVDLADVVMGIGGFSLEGDGFGEDAGFAVAGAGDVNGDGLADVIIGAPEGGPFPGGGRAYVVHGKTDTTAVLLDDVYSGIGGFAIHGVGFDDNAGTSVAGAGDVNADGLSDVLVGAPLANAGGMGNAGRSYVVFGRTNTTVVNLSMLGTGGFFIDGEDGFDEAGSELAGVGDVDGDGLGDVLIGAPQADDAVLLQGRAYLVRGKTDSTTVSLADVAMGMGGFVIDGEFGADFLGTSVGGGGDIDADGYGDLVLGTANVGVPGPTAGRGYVVFGKGDGGSVPLADLTLRLGGFSVNADAAQGWLGWRTAHAGDVDGDGYADMILSAIRADSPAGNDAGRTYVVFGGNYSGAVSHQGDELDDVIVGSGGSDVIVAGAGADEIHGEGGSDIIRAGAGDDVIGILNGSFFRIDGGSGQDTLAFEDDNVQLDLNVVSDVAIRNIEVFDITGTGDNVLQLGLRDLRAIVGPSRTLRVEGDAMDTVNADLTGGAFVDMGVAGGVHTYSDGVFTLELAEALGGAVML